MFQTAYYVIRPAERLAQLLDASGHDWAGLLDETTIWSRGEGCSIALPIDTWVDLREAQVKLLFMLNLASDYLPDTGSPTNEFQSFLVGLLEYPSVRMETFDKWWSLERIEALDDTFENAETGLAKRHLDSVVIPPLDGAAEWIEHLYSTAKP